MLSPRIELTCNKHTILLASLKETGGGGQARKRREREDGKNAGCGMWGSSKHALWNSPSRMTMAEGVWKSQIKRRHHQHKAKLLGRRSFRSNQWFLQQPVTKLSFLATLWNARVVDTFS